MPPPSPLGDGPSDKEPYDSGGDPLSLRVVEAVAAFRGVDPLELDPLAESIDADALNGLFSPVSAGNTADISFTYEGVRVTVTSRGDIDLREADRE